jgi:uncharacterized membrane protein
MSNITISELLVETDSFLTDLSDAELQVSGGGHYGGGKKKGSGSGKKKRGSGSGKKRGSGSGKKRGGYGCGCHC